MPRKIFVAGEILTAADVNTNLMDQAVMVFDDASARTTAIPTPVEGMVTYLKDDDEVTVFDGSAFKAVGPGKILQVVRGADNASRSTTSATYIDVTGLTVTITPQQSNSTILLILSCNVLNFSNNNVVHIFSLRITDNDGTPVPGAEETRSGTSGFTLTAGQSVFVGQADLIGFATPATTDSVTFKTQFKSETTSSTTRIQGDVRTSQLYAIEVSA